MVQGVSSRSSIRVRYSPRRLGVAASTPAHQGHAALTGADALRQPSGGPMGRAVVGQLVLGDPHHLCHYARRQPRPSALVLGPPVRAAGTGRRRTGSRLYAAGCFDHEWVGVTRTAAAPSGGDMGRSRVGPGAGVTTVQPAAWSRMQPLPPTRRRSQAPFWRALRASWGLGIIIGGVAPGVVEWNRPK
jgi:hypothetical protein